MNEIEQRKPIPLIAAIFPFLWTIGSLIAGIFIIHIPIYVGLLSGWLVTIFIAMWYRYPLKQLVFASYKGMKQTYVVVSILVLIGGVIAIWMASGTVAGLIVFSSHSITPSYMVVTAFCLAAVMSMLLGTSVGTLSTIGIVLVGIAQLNQIPVGLIGGALMSGAMIGDRTSPLSGTVHLLGSTVGIKPESSFKTVLRSALPVIILCIVAYTILGYNATSPQMGTSSSEEIQQLQQVFTINWVVILPPALVLTLALLRIPIRTNLLLGLFFGIILSHWIQHLHWDSIAATIWIGSHIATNGHTLLQGGGIWNMLNQMFIILSAGALNGALETTGMMESLIGQLLERTKREGSLILETIGVSLLTGLVFCNQALMVILPGNMLRKKYDDLQIKRVELVRTLSDSGVVTSALIPWNLHGILCSTAMGIHTVTYAPFAFLLWGLPVTAIARGIWKNIRFRVVHVQS